MPTVPILNRLNWHDYQGLIITLAFVLVESMLRLVVAVLPVSFLRHWIFDPILKCMPKVPGRESEEERFAGCRRFTDLAAIWGYDAQEHLVETRDGYVLTLHRIATDRRYATADDSSDDEETVAAAAADAPLSSRSCPGKEDEDQARRPVVLLWHGFMMNSEVFACSPDREKNLAFVLVDQGYDVWLGNSRGNKYSYKHRHRRPDEREFWDFSLDELAAYDLPASVDFILAETGEPDLSYIGFSQGTAQAFASLSINRELNRKVSLFIALAPATKPPGLENRLVNALAKSSPHFVYLLFGRRRGLSVALFWCDILPRRLYTACIDACTHFLFGWHSQNMSLRQRNVCYAHLYSYSSVKTIAHWFQIIGARRFQSYDDLPPTRLTDSADSDQAGHIAFSYPTHRITTPIALFYGACDSLSNIHELLKDLPRPVYAREVELFEHLDFLWADTAHTAVYPDVLRLLAKNATRQQPLLHPTSNIAHSNVIFSTDDKPRSKTAAVDAS